MTATQDTAKSDPHGYEEDCDYALRAQLGLRAIYFPTVEIENAVIPHPDESPCPSWCWIAEQDEHCGKVEFGHSVEHEDIGRAVHTMSANVAVRASLYEGDHEKHGPSAPGVVAATIEPSLEQTGAGRPMIRVGLRHGNRDYEPERLRMTVDDARDLVKVLNHLIGLIDAEDQR